MQKDKDRKSSNQSHSHGNNWHGGDRSNSSAGRKTPSRTSSNDRK